MKRIYPTLKLLHLWRQGNPVTHQDGIISPYRQTTPAQGLLEANEQAVGRKVYSKEIKLSIWMRLTYNLQPAVESAVTRLLVAIKQLLESLTQWSHQQITEAQVSDVYVRLGNDFNAAVAAFAAFDIDMS